MRHLMPCLVVCLCLTSTFALPAQQIQEKATPERVADLIGKLGSSKFAERERAMKELETLGPSGLPLLRPALTSSDLEVQRRVEMLVRKFEDQQIAATLLVGSRVRLKVKDVTTFEAVAELAKVSGYPVELSEAQWEVGTSRVTLDTGDTTYWEALQQLCLKAGLVDTGTTGIIFAKHSDSMFIPGNRTSSGTLQVVAGKAAEIPTSFIGSIRLRLLKSTLTPNGDIDLLVEGVAEPRLLSFGSAGVPCLNKVIDDQGQLLARFVIANEMGPPEPAPAKIRFSSLNTQHVGFRPFEVTVRLKPSEKSATKLQEITGNIPVLCTVEGEPDIVVDNILKAAGQTIRRKNG